MNFNNTKALANLELLRTVQEESENKSIPSDTVFDVISEVISELSKKKYGDNRVCVEINKKTGSITTLRKLRVIDNNSSEVFDDGLPRVTIEEALKIDSQAKPGDVINEILPPVTVSNAAMSRARWAMSAKMREIERKKHYDLFKTRVGDIVSCVVTKVDINNIIVELGGAEGCLPMRNTIQGETVRKGDQIRVYIESVERKNKGHQIIVSRSHDNFLLGLFKESIPEISDGIVELVGASRNPGSRSKVAVRSTDKNIDPIGSCIGIRGSRIHSIITEIKGEKVDVVEFSSDPSTFAINAISPAEVLRVIMDSERKKMEMIVPEEQLSLAIGRKGQNVRLASNLIGWKIEVISDADASERRLKEFHSCTEFFKEALNVEEVIAQLLVTESFMSIEDILKAELSDLVAIEGFDEEIANEIIERAHSYVRGQEELILSRIKDLGMENKLINLLDLEPDKIVKIGDSGIKTMNDLADLSRDEFLDVCPGLENSVVDSFIMSARKEMGWLD